MGSERFGAIIDPKFIGLAGPEFEMPVELGKLREFARATCAPLPDYLEDRHAVVPPTFLVVAAYFWGYLLERPGDTPLAEIGADTMMSLDGGQRFDFHGPLPRAGDVLRVRTVVEDVRIKQGRSGGRLSIITMLTSFRAPDGRLVAEWRPTSVVPEYPPTGGVDAAPKDGAWPFMKKGDPRDQMTALPRQGWNELRIGDGPGAITMPPLTLTDIVRYSYASGEDSIAHHDHWAARAEGFPTFFSVGMLHAGLLATYAVAWLGPARVRSFEARFNDMIWPGDELAYSGKVEALREANGERLADIALDCMRGDKAVTTARATFAL